MKNLNVDAFMANYVHDGLTFDDVSLETQYADFLPSETDTASRISRNVPLNIPYVSAAMDTVTESGMAIAMARLEKPNSAASQFFINVKDNPDFDRKNDTGTGCGYAVFGQITSGIAVADSIAAIEVDTGSKPKIPMVIFSMKVRK